MTALASVANAADPIQYLRTHPHLIIEASPTNGGGTSSIGKQTKNYSEFPLCSKWET